MYCFTFLLCILQCALWIDKWSYIFKIISIYLFFNSKKRINSSESFPQALNRHGFYLKHNSSPRCTAGPMPFQRERLEPVTFLSTEFWPGHTQSFCCHRSLGVSRRPRTSLIIKQHHLINHHDVHLVPTEVTILHARACVFVCLCVDRKPWSIIGTENLGRWAACRSSNDYSRRKKVFTSHCAARNWVLSS